MNPLKNLKVLEFEGLAPSIHTAMVLADYGADITLIRNPSQKQFSPHTFLNDKKKIVSLDLKQKQDVEKVKQMYKESDVVIDCFRPSVLEKLGLGPETAFNMNPKIIFCRISGFGQKGQNSLKAGHDINYLAESGVLSTIGTPTQPIIPHNILSDFAGGGLHGALGILLGLLETQKTGVGKTVDVSLTDSVSYMSNWMVNMKQQGLWNLKRGNNMLDGGAHFYQVYKCQDEGFMAVGSIESKFYQKLLKGLEFSDEQIEKMVAEQLDQEKWEGLKKEFAILFMKKTRNQWENIFNKLDCCVTPVLELQEKKNTTSTITQDEGEFGFRFKPNPIFQDIIKPKL